MNVEGDVVLIHYRDKPTIYARIEYIEADIKKDWYQFTLLLLTIPPQTVKWILREEYINGAPFTMGGIPMMIEEVKRVLPLDKAEEQRVTPNKKETEKTGKVIPFKTNSD